MPTALATVAISMLNRCTLTPLFPGMGNPNPRCRGASSWQAARMCRSKTYMIPRRLLETEAGNSCADRCLGPTIVSHIHPIPSQSIALAHYQAYSRRFRAAHLAEQEERLRKR